MMRKSLSQYTAQDQASIFLRAFLRKLVFIFVQEGFHSKALPSSYHKCSVDNIFVNLKWSCLWVVQRLFCSLIQTMIVHSVDPDRDPVKSHWVFFEFIWPVLCSPGIFVANQFNLLWSDAIEVKVLNFRYRSFVSERGLDLFPACLFNVLYE